MHVFEGKVVASVFHSTFGSGRVERINRNAPHSGLGSDNQLEAKELPVSLLKAVAVRLVAGGGVLMPPEMFSTQAFARIQLRDIDFVTCWSVHSYLATGVETRGSVTCAPALPLTEFARSVARSIVSRLP